MQARPVFSWRWLWGPLLVIGLVPMGAGCGGKADIVLHQPFAPPTQQDMRLVSDRAFCRRGPAEETCALTFGLPGHKGGVRAFVLYVTGPSDLKPPRVASDEQGAVRGFLIQEVGNLAGRTDFVAGEVRCRKLFLRKRLWQLDFDVRCEDGTRITGRARVGEDPRAVRAIERAFAADISSLASRTAEPSTERETASRPSGEQ